MGQWALEGVFILYVAVFLFPSVTLTALRNTLTVALERSASSPCPLNVVEVASISVEVLLRSVFSW